MRRRGMTLVELVFTIGIVVLTIGFLGQAGTIALRWHETADASIGVTTTAERLRALVGEASRTARPVDALSVGPSGELVERPLPGAARTWKTGEALILRSTDAYWVFEQERTRLVRRRIGFDGRSEVVEVVAGVTAARWSFVASEGRPLGLAYSVAVAARKRPIEGFLALRTPDVVTSPPESPRPAPRYPSARDNGGGK